MLANFSAILVFVSIALLLQTYLIYPLGLWLLAKFTRDTKLVEATFRTWPQISVIVPARNEALNIEQKVKNFFELEYAGKLELIFADDNSSDQSLSILNALCEKYENIKVISVENKSGKSSLINRLVPFTNSEIIILTDASAKLSKNLASRAAIGLQDNSTGMLGFRLLYKNHEEQGKTAENLYWDLETFMRLKESRIYSALQTSGAACAFKKSNFIPLPSDCLCDDLHLPLSMLMGEKRIKYDMQAYVTEMQSGNLKNEFKRRSRIGSGNFQIVKRFVHLLNPKLGYPALFYFNHKLLKWLGPVWLILIYMGSMLNLSSPLFWWFFVLQTICYALVIVGIYKEISFRPLKILSHFVLMNMALLWGFLLLIVSKPDGTWGKTDS